MAMRITTKMMQTTSLNNLNTNKSLQEMLTTQLSTMKKINRPSDDPVIAIRSLRLNSSLNKIDQYYEKNSEDAKSWLKLTESAIDTATEILKSMRADITQEVNGNLTITDRKAIMEKLHNYKKEVYATGNADSAGRSIFTGYRTDTTLTCLKDKTELYRIVEQRNNTIIDKTTFVKTGDLSEINEGNYLTKSTTEYDVSTHDIARIRTAYQNLDVEQDPATGEFSADVHLSYLMNTQQVVENGEKGVQVPMSNYTLFVSEDATDANAMNLTFSDINGNQTQVTVTRGTTLDLSATLGIMVDMTSLQNDKTLKVSEVDAAGTVTRSYEINAKSTRNENNEPIFDFEAKCEVSISITSCFKDNTDEAYESAIGAANADAVVYIAETGEILLGENIHNELAALDFNTEIRIGYEKSQWKEGDLDPIHYFYCTRDDAVLGRIEYNEAKLSQTGSDNANQIISYEVGSNQSIRVNTIAQELYTHDIGRDIDDLIAMLDQQTAIQTAQETVKKMIESEKYAGAELEHLELQLKGLNKSMTMLGDKIQKTIESYQTVFDGYIEQATTAYTDCGSRMSRLELVQNRLLSQQTNFEELVSKNEDADVTDLAIQLSSIQLTYEAALSSISYVMKTTLLDFI